MNILICDDQEHDREILRTYVEAYMNSHGIPCEISETMDPRQPACGKERYEMAFLDIRMPGMDGIQLAKILRQRNERMLLFFITGYEDYQDAAMDLHAMRYFSKPFEKQRLYAGLDKAMEYIDDTFVDVYLHLSHTWQRILTDDIYYVTRENRKCLLKAKQGYCLFDARYEEWCRRLPPRYFYQVHKSYFVNMHYIQTYSYTEIYLIDGTRIPVSTRRQAAFHQYWFDYMERR